MILFNSRDDTAPALSRPELARTMILWQMA
jgi:hypothetical protein